MPVFQQPTQATWAYGTIIRMNGVPVAEVDNISGPKMKRDTQDVTSHSSPDGWREFIGTLRDGGEISFDINFNPTGSTHSYSTGLLSQFATSNTVATWDLIFPNTAATTWTFPGIMTGFEPKFDTDKIIGASISIKVSGKPTLA